MMMDLSEMRARGTVKADPKARRYVVATFTLIPSFMASLKSTLTAVYAICTNTISNTGFNPCIAFITPFISTIVFVWLKVSLNGKLGAM